MHRVAGAAALVVLVLGLVGILVLTTIPGFRFYRVPWLIPTAVVAAIVLAVAVVLLRLWCSRQRWSGEVAAPAELLVGVRPAFDRGRLVAACILLTPLGGALYAALVGRTVVRLRGPFDPERTAVVEVRLRCRDREEASVVAARAGLVARLPRRLEARNEASGGPRGGGRADRRGVLGGVQPPPDGSGATVEPTATDRETPSPAPTPEPSPVEMAVRDLPTEGEDLLPVRSRLDQRG